jgi:hypothetical protein
MVGPVKRSLARASCGLSGNTLGLVDQGYIRRKTRCFLYRWRRGAPRNSRSVQEVESWRWRMSSRRADSGLCNLGRPVADPLAWQVETPLWSCCLEFDLDRFWASNRESRLEAKSQSFAHHDSPIASTRKKEIWISSRRNKRKTALNLCDKPR